MGSQGKFARRTAYTRPTLQAERDIRGSQTLGSRSTSHDYLLANSGKEAGTRFAALAELFDSGTIRHLENCGVNRGWQCLEVGGGGGSIAGWLAERVGATGHLLVTDIDTRFLRMLQRPNVEVRQHDIALDPLPKATFDLVHARLVLLHVPQREQALERMIAALRPGGWLVIEEYDSASMPPDSKASPGEVLLNTHVAMMKIFEESGVDRRYGRLLFGRLRVHGLTDIGAEGRVFMFHHGDSGASMLKANYEQLRTKMIDCNYITSTQFDEDLAHLDNPGFMMPSGVLWSVRGRRP